MKDDLTLPCESCGGKGTVDVPGFQRCISSRPPSDCDGDCPRCGGVGPCSICDGTGRVADLDRCCLSCWAEGKGDLDSLVAAVGDRGLCLVCIVEGLPDDAVAVA